jgi:hypothetical protein
VSQKLTGGGPTAGDGVAEQRAGMGGVRRRWEASAMPAHGLDAASRVSAFA